MAVAWFRGGLGNCSLSCCTQQPLLERPTSTVFPHNFSLNFRRLIRVQFGAFTAGSAALWQLRWFERPVTCARSRAPGGSLPQPETTVNFRFRAATAQAVSFL